MKKRASMYRSLKTYLTTVGLIVLLASCIPASQMTTYSGSSWRTLQGDKSFINEFCAKRLGPSPQGSWDSCFLPRERIIACSGGESCLKAASNAAEASSRLTYNLPPSPPTYMPSSTYGKKPGG